MMQQENPFRIVGPGKRAIQRPCRRSWRERTGHIPVISLFFLICIISGCVLAPVLANHDPTQFYLQHLNQPPDSEFYFGTDSLGRDIYSIIWYGGRISLTVGVLSMIVSACIGISYGCLSGTAPEWADMLLMRLAELLSSIPGILLLLLLMAFVPNPDVLSISVLIGVTMWMNLARMVRSEVRQIRNSEYVLASRSMGGGFWHILWYHLIPNTVSALLFMIISMMGKAMMTEATLSFLGLGLPVGIVSWGTMLSLANRALLTNSWWVILIPGAFLIITLICVTSAGDMLRKEKQQGCSNL